MDYKEINDKVNEHYKTRGELRLELCAAIHEMLSELGGTMNTEDEEFGDSLWICYDGGRHVEYDSTMNCRVDSVTATVAKDVFRGTDYKTFTVDCENESGMAEYRVMFDDLTAIFDLVYARYNYFKEHGEE